jgi:two-component system nitrate/nitrite response regulator NarL
MSKSGPPRRPVIRLLVAGNQPIVVAGIRAVLGDTAFLMLRELHDGEGIEQAISECRPDMVVLDEQLADKRTGIDAFLSLRADGDVTPVILLIGDKCEDGLLQAIEAGVDGVVPKSSAPLRLVQCLDTVRDGNRSIDQELLHRAAGRSIERQEKAAVLSSLSPREQEIVRLLAADLRASEIAQRLNISSVTVKVHLHNIYAKLGLTNRAALLRLIRQSQGARPVTEDESSTTIIAVPGPRDLT